MNPRFTKAEAGLFAFPAALLLAALALPPVPPSAQQHHFADARVLWGVPNAMDVLSNLPFLVSGLAGLGLIAWLRRSGLGNMERAMGWLFFLGLVLVAPGSAIYHLDPCDATLTLDRVFMAIAFAGALGLAAAAHVSERAGAALGLALLVAGPAAVQVWQSTGNVLPWALVQFGGMLALLALALLRPREGALRVDWALVLLAYGLAKLLEVNDDALFAMTGEWVSGHTLKHWVAALAAVPVLAGFLARRPRRQNAQRTPAAGESRLARWHKA